MTRSLELVASACSICGMRTSGELVATGKDFEQLTGPGTFSMYLCTRCDAMYLDPRPTMDEMIELSSGFGDRERTRSERRKLLALCKGVRPGGSILVLGPDAGFQTRTLKEHGDHNWNLTVVVPQPARAAELKGEGFLVYQGALGELRLMPDQFDFVVMGLVIEQVDDPVQLLREVRRVLKPRGQVGVVTNNIGSIAFRFGRERHWGGYNFPRHFNLYSRPSLIALANRAGLEVRQVATMPAPVSWLLTRRNRKMDRGADGRGGVSGRPLSLAFFTIVETLARAIGRGALLRATLQKR